MKTAKELDDSKARYNSHPARVSLRFNPNHEVEVDPDGKGISVLVYEFGMSVFNDRFLEYLREHVGSPKADAICDETYHRVNRQIILETLFKD